MFLILLREEEVTTNVGDVLGLGDSLEDLLGFVYSTFLKEPSYRFIRVP